MQLKSLISTLALAILCYLNCFSGCYPFSRITYFVAAILLKEKAKIENGENWIGSKKNFIGKNSLADSINSYNYASQNIKQNIMDLKNSNNKILINEMKEKSFSPAEFLDTGVRNDLNTLMKKNDTNSDVINNLSNSTKDQKTLNEKNTDSNNLDPDKIKELDFDKFYNFNQAVPGIDYLGIGYDVVFGNPVGEPKEMIDPGYRAPIVDLLWNSVDKGAGMGLYSSQLIEAWTRSEVTCQRSEMVEEVSTISKYQSQLSTDADLNLTYLPFFLFSASSSYKNFVKNLSKKNKITYLMRTYCIRYRAELSKYLPWKTKIAFNQVFEYLPETFDGLKNTTTCPINLYKLNNFSTECSLIHKWMRFFKEFGTHIISGVHLGGKLTTQITINKDDIEELNKKKIDINAEIRKFSLDPFNHDSYISSISSKSESYSNLKNESVEKIIIVLGGKPPKTDDSSSEFQNWAESIAELPMPVKISLTPLSITMSDKPKLKEAYENAFTYYGKVYGLTNNEIENITGDHTKLTDKLAKGKQITYAGPPPGSIVCPNDKVIMLGWALHMNVHDNAGNLEAYHMVECKPGHEKCMGVGEKYNSNDDTRIWAICGEEPIIGLIQVVAEGKKTVSAKCPDGYTIGLGFGLSLSDGSNGPESTSIYACRSGMNSCEMENSKNAAKNYVWIACFDSTINGIKEINNIVNLGTVGKVDDDKKYHDGSVEVSCEKNTTVIGGWLMEIHESLNNQYIQRSFITCNDSTNPCTLNGYGYNGGGIFKVNRHALVGYIVCGSSIDEKIVKTVEKQ